MLPLAADYPLLNIIWTMLVFFGLFLWAGLWAIDVEKATAFIVGCLGGAAVFLFVRHFGGEAPPADRRR